MNEALSVIDCITCILSHLSLTKYMYIFKCHSRQYFLYTLLHTLSINQTHLCTRQTLQDHTRCTYYSRVILIEFYKILDEQYNYEAYLCATCFCGCTRVALALANWNLPEKLPAGHPSQHKFLTRLLHSLVADLS
jgi:hypothetical protein